MQPIGALQPGLPSPTAIPKDTCKVILDLNDHFYAIPLAPQDCQRFASGSPSVNLKEPMKRYQRSVLPQSMANRCYVGPEICGLGYTICWRPIPTSICCPLYG